MKRHSRKLAIPHWLDLFVVNIVCS